MHCVLTQSGLTITAPNGINLLGFVVETNCVLCEVRTELVYKLIIYLNVRRQILERFNLSQRGFQIVRSGL